MTRPQDILLVFLAACRDVARRAKPEASLIFVFLCALRDLRGEQKTFGKRINNCEYMHLGKEIAVYEEPFIPELTTEGLTAEELSQVEYRIKQQNQRTGALAPFLLSILPASQPSGFPAFETQ